ncbi:hypothetical protein [Nitriliruptor alkaliphilus]|uniref:hypothetical protein n=1 Tax=Nitriliruptor alkaliphilus TaxID=427918 RepID=UPI00069795D9|nr:hypothetical protein [Nitriliruptor alkaliphilus]
MERVGARSRVLMPAVIVAVLAGACTSATDDDVPVDDGQVVDAGEVGDEAVTEQAAPGGRLQLTGWAEDHPKVMTVALRAIEVDAAGNLLIDIEAVNSSLHGNSASIGMRGVLARDDLGNVYDFVRPEGNGRLQFVRDERMTGTLAFEGPVDPAARTVTVAFNQQDDAETLIRAAEDNLNQFPRFLFEQVPLPGVGLEAEADRGGTADALTTEQEIEVGVTVQPEINEGVSVTVLRYRTDGRTITVELEAVNNSNRVVELTSGNPHLRDGRDTKYGYQRSESDDRDERVLRMDPGQEVTAVLAWRGLIPDDAEFLALEINSERWQTPTSPHVYVEMPLPGQDR